MKNIKISLSDIPYRIYTQIWVKSIRRGLLIIQPLILVNCLFAILTQIQIVEFKEFMNFIFSDNWLKTLTNIYEELYAIIKILIIITINYSLADIRNSVNKQSINPIIVSIVGVLSPIILTSSFQYTSGSIVSAKWSFFAIIVSMISSEIFMYIYVNITKKIKITESTYDRTLQKSINSFLPIFIIISVLFIIKNFIINNFDELYGFIINIIDENNISSKNDIFKYIKYLFSCQFYWFFGGHGGDIVDPNLVTKSYMNVFCNIGGAGSTISLIIGILILNSNKYKKNIAKISILPSIFNINELVLYGLPVILNPIYLIPFMITPIILMITTQIAFEIGLIQLKVNSINFMTPIIFNAYQVTGSLNGVVLQIINIIIGIFTYIPFIRIHDQMHRKEEEIAYNDFKNEVFSNNVERLKFNQREDNVGDIARLLSIELSKSIIEKEGIYLEYQPQVNKSGNVIGVEALLRWKHKEFGNIPPNMIIIIAEEIGLIHKLGNWIIDEACSQLLKWNKELDESIDMSINISTIQLKDNLFIENTKNTLKKYNLNPKNIKLEITESLALGDDEITKSQLNKLSELGIKLAIDDFGIGYNPILYIKKYNIDTIKIDGSLIRDIDTNEDSRRIVQAMYILCKSSSIEIINEFVETKEQKYILDQMGDGFYQGYLFSKPLSSDKCIKYIKNNIDIGA